MKHYLIIILFLCANILIAQEKNDSIPATNNKLDIVVKNTKAPAYRPTKNADEAIREGDKAAKAEYYENAINYFLAAQAFDESRRKEVTKRVGDAFKEITALKNKAEAALAEAIRQKKIADEQRIIAIKQTEIAVREKKAADIARDAAIESEKIAVAALAEAEKQTRIAIAQREIAKEQERIAIEQREIAEKQTRIAIRERARAERLRIEALSVAIAIKSSAMEYHSQDTLKALLALEAYNMQMTVNNDPNSTKKGLVSPEIYTGLHDAVIKVKGEKFDEVNKEDGAHNGAIRSIIPVNDKGFYTMGSDGKLIKWNIKSWDNPGKPIFELDIVQNKKNIDLAAAMHPDGEFLAIGGKFPQVEFINPSGSLFKKPNLGQKRHPNYTFEDIDEIELKGIYDLKFQGNTLYLLGKEGKLKSLNVKNKEVKLLKKLKQKAERMAVHPNGDMLAIGYTNGQIDIYDVSDFTTPKYEFKFKRFELANKNITALAFDETMNHLAFGTSDGHLSIIKPENGIYLLDSMKVRKPHELRVSSIDFKPYKSADGEQEVAMAAGNYDGTATVWQMSKFEKTTYEPLRFDDKGTWVTSLSFVKNANSPSKNKLIVGYFDGTLKFWDLDVKNLANDLMCTVESQFSTRPALLKVEIEKYQLSSLDIKVLRYAKCGNE